MQSNELINQFVAEEDIKVLMKDNSLIKAKYNLTLVQNRIFEILLYKFQKEKDGILSCEVHRDEFKKLIGKEKDKTIKGISDLLESLRVKEILIAEKIKGKDKYKWHRYGLINGSTYNEETDTFTIRATAEIYELIQNYYDKREGYTPINLIIKLGMNNYYAQRLYDLLRVWSGSKTIIRYEVNELKELLQIENKYDLYGDFKKRVISPAIKELNSTGYFEIDVKENKVGRRVESIDFIVKDKDKRKYFQQELDIDNLKIIKERKIEVIEEVKPKNNFYIPDKSVFTAGTLRSFKIDFCNYDFKDEYMLKAFNDAIMVTLEREDKSKVYATAYKFFRGTLKNKINYYQNEKQEDIEHQENIAKYWYGNA